MVRKAIALVGLFLMGAVWGFGMDDLRQPPKAEIVVPCPSEDTCDYPTIPKGWSADYRHKAWHITEGNK